MTLHKNNQARAINELFCKILEENEICSIRAETLRQAKFNKDAAAKAVGQVLFSVVGLCDSHNKKSDWESQIHVSNDEQRMIFIKTKLQSWGYLSQSFAQLPNDFSCGSRELLLALGYVIHQKHFIDKVISRHSNPLHQDLVSFLRKEDSSVSEKMFLDSAYHAVQLNIKDRIQYHMILTGKLRLALRRLYSVYQHLTSLTKTIQESTEGVSLQQQLSHLTPLEVHVLRFPSSFRKLLQEMERDNQELSHLLEWKQKESLFWEWMGSVLTAHIEDQDQASSAASSCENASLEPSVFLPVPSDIGDQVEAARDHLRDVILRHEKEMTKVEHLIRRKKVSSVEAEVHKMHMDKELFEKTLQLRSCGFDEEDSADTLSSCEETCEAAAAASSPKMSTEHNTQRRRSTRENNKVLSPCAAKAARQEAFLKAVNREVSNLTEKVEKLKADLRHTQMQNIERVQALINMDESVICIQPRSVKQYYCNQ
ncbi:chromosome 14 open reading frame 80 [Plakobranchus ocellatus]|uniref:Chromosome 14 open reading frame 80 n=1 Tax=Plakobranchus ocellatus TaxID=259542 RepID=A0AAV4AI28_9GAST|nr:chromosome 14 open reading frame 80 [Plakobranchus ocellatus]